MSFGASEYDKIFIDAYEQRDRGVQKNNPHTNDADKFWSFEFGWCVTSESLGLIKRWNDVCLKASEWVKGQKLNLNSGLREHQTLNGPCVFVETTIKGEIHNGLVLPTFTVESQGQLVEAHHLELSGIDRAGVLFDLTLDVIMGSYNAARQKGYRSPMHIILQGNERDLKTFIEFLETAESVDPAEHV